MTGERRGRTRLVLPAVLILLAAVSGCGTDAAAPEPTPPEAPPRVPAGWAGFGRDHGNSRFNPDETAVTATSVKTLAPAWHLENLGGLSGTPAVVDGTVYFGDWNSDVHAVDAADGHEL